ncbi:MAG TPA: hypothetical protein VFS21_22625 [Roseiflexaceae bacterium]|nr:hypothetical protein [Roseiflexaceae bacterium]
MSHDELAPEAEEPVFAYRTSKDGKVFISWHGRTVTTLAGPAAQRFLARVAAGDDAAAQLEMARVTGNFKRGNERLGKMRDRSS